MMVLFVNAHHPIITTGWSAWFHAWLSSFYFGKKRLNWSRH